MAPVQLPNQPTGNISLLPQPQDPATLVDTSNAINYDKQVIASHGMAIVFFFVTCFPLSPEREVATKNDVGETALIAQHAGAVAPPWFAGALQQGLAAALAPLKHVVYITHNRGAGNGRDCPFEVVPFANGESPVDQPHNLPALVNVDIINALTGQQASAYLTGYGIPIPRAVAQRRKAVRLAVGCIAEN